VLVVEYSPARGRFTEIDGRLARGRTDDGWTVARHTLYTHYHFYYYLLCFVMFIMYARRLSYIRREGGTRATSLAFKACSDAISSQELEIERRRLFKLLPLPLPPLLLLLLLLLLPLPLILPLPLLLLLLLRMLAGHPESRK
jgi:hypothetical protein